MSTISEFMDRITANCGNRGGDIRNVILNAANTAFNVVMNIHKTTERMGIFEATLPASTEYIILPEEAETVAQAAWYDNDEDEWTPLHKGNMVDIMSIGSGDYVDKYTQVKRRLWIYPKVTVPVEVRFLSTVRYVYLTDTTLDVPIISSLEPSAEFIATAIVRLHLGEIKTAAALRQFAAMFGSKDMGPEAVAKAMGETKVSMKLE